MKKDLAFRGGKKKDATMCDITALRLLVCLWMRKSPQQNNLTRNTFYVSSYFFYLAMQNFKITVST